MKVRIFLTAWIIFSVHFATNTVREHYPAFSLIEQGTFKVDRYLDFHPDIFQHQDGHAYVGNNVAASVIAAVPLLVFKPVLDWLERYEQEKIKDRPPQTEYRNTDHPNSQAFYSVVSQKGLTLRFGAATVVTSVFLMAPLSAGLVVLMFSILIERGVATRLAVWLAFLFAFGTPIFFRTGVLNHNMMVMYAAFVAFHLLWVRPGGTQPVSVTRRTIAGVLGGFCFALDYSGIIPLALLFAYLVVNRARTTGWWPSIRESVPFVLATVPPVLFLLYSQWSMFGDPFMPGQYWMPDVSTSPVFGTFRNPHSTEGFRGFTWPAADLFLLNFFSPSYGMYTYGPLLILGMIPVSSYRRTDLILPKPERWFVAALVTSLLLFCAANQYSRIQENSGFRYLVPLIPFVFLQLSDHLVRMPRQWLLLLSIPVLLNSWFIAMVREPVPESWGRVLSEGIQLPWLHVLTLVLPPGHVLGSVYIPLAVLAATAGVVALVWRFRRPRMGTA